ncbi:ty3-gypsy retrotransposon protein [Cucumis melo var. makuwa]|uniref:Ty3-gypsy retrotransposon protein n=1 Tax=Cucumis melo var. makuwa TaxID=1194695 RepID=A0A5D3DJH5_CUCMM|nr:ty3-gypsy retrotransposon protein [Cucumis melo var. makuwa]
MARQTLARSDRLTEKSPGQKPGRRRGVVVRVVYGCATRVVEARLERRGSADASLGSRTTVEWWRGESRLLVAARIGHGGDGSDGGYGFQLSSNVRSSRPHPFPISLLVSRNQTPPCVLRLTVSADAQPPSAASFVKKPTTDLQRSWISGLVYSLSVDSIEGHNQVSGKGFPTTGPRIEAGNVVIHRRLYVSNVIASCSLCAIVCNELFTDRHRCPDVLCIVVMIMGYVVNWNCMSMDLKVLRLGKGTARGRPTRDKKDALVRKVGSYSWYQSLSFRFCRLTYDVSLCFCVLMANTILATRQPVAQATDQAAPVTHANLAAMEQRLRDLIMQLREQQQPAPPALAPAPVVPQVVPDQLSAEAKHLRDFRKYNPTTFDGSLEDPTRAQLLLSSLETIFRYMKCPEDQKVQCVIFMLTDRGTAWWETTERMLGGDVGQITWHQFKESFYAKFFSASLRDAKQQKFLNLEQDDITVEQHDAEFDMLSRFAPKMIATEAARADKEAARGKPLCTTCGKHHLGRCLFGTGTRTCFKCRQEGHTVDRCPMRLTGNAQNQGAGAPHQGKIFATNKTEAQKAGTVVTGTLLVLGHYTLVLFDSGLSHSFISSAFVLHARLEIEIAGHVIEVTLLVLDMLDFDVILGMDWLVANHASIDCSRKEVAFNLPSLASFKFKREGSRSLPKVISAMRASKLLSQGTWSILASMVDTRQVDVSLSSEPVVRDYLDVFPEELSRLPPHNEIEFAIELEPGTVPISRAPYKIAPAELKELKVQLQELLDKGFIRPSVSP